MKTIPTKDNIRARFWRMLLAVGLLVSCFALGTHLVSNKGPRTYEITKASSQETASATTASRGSASSSGFYKPNYRGKSMSEADHTGSLQTMEPAADTPELSVDQAKEELHAVLSESGMSPAEVERELEAVFGATPQGKKSK